MYTIEVGKFRSCNRPYVIAFVYPKNHSPVRLTGMYDEVETYIEENFPISIYNVAFYNGGCFHNWWGSPCQHLSISRTMGDYDENSHRYKSKNGWTVTNYHGSRWSSPSITKHNFRRMPHKWIDLFEE